jgi:hypothetical protein
MKAEKLPKLKVISSKTVTSLKFVSPAVSTLIIGIDEFEFSMVTPSVWFSGPYALAENRQLAAKVWNVMLNPDEAGIVTLSM